MIAAALVEWGWRVLLAGGAVIEILAVVLGLLIAGHRPALYRGTPPDDVLSEE